MKTKKPNDRKTSLDNVLRQANKISSYPKECQQAWLRLCGELENMSHPEARMPRFNTLVNALWRAATGEQT